MNDPGDETQPIDDTRSIDEILAAARTHLDRVEPGMLKASAPLAL